MCVIIHGRSARRRTGTTHTVMTTGNVVGGNGDPLGADDPRASEAIVWWGKW
jgi:hypothetical protein